MPRTVKTVETVKTMEIVDEVISNTLLNYQNNII
jgi:hypothetical protein